MLNLFHNCLISFQDELIPGAAQDQEALLITLTRPIILAQPLAFDKGERNIPRYMQVKRQVDYSHSLTVH